VFDFFFPDISQLLVFSLQLFYEISASPLVGVLCDDSSDVRNRENMALHLRFVGKNQKQRDVFLEVCACVD
jgi:hypothetical protein